jgi:hypothetical protein
MQACALTYPGLTIIVGGSGAIPETDGVSAGANVGVVTHCVPLARLRRAGCDCAETDRDELSHVSLPLQKAPFSWHRPPSFGRTIRRPSVPTEALGRLGRLKLLPHRVNIQHGVQPLRYGAIGQADGQIVPPALIGVANQ